MSDYPGWCEAVVKCLDGLDTGAFLTDDETMNAQEAYDEGCAPTDFAARVAERRDWDQAKASGDLWR